MKTIIADMYLEYLNDFLTIERFASYYDLSDYDASEIVSMGRKFHNERTGG